MIDALALRDIADLGQRPEQWQSTIADVIAPGAVVHEPHDLVAELPVLQDAVGHHASEITGSGDENPLQTNPGAPAALEQLANRLPRQVCEHHVQSQEEPPHDLGYLVRAAHAGLLRRKVGLDVQGGDDAEHDGQDAADEDREEVVDARSPAAETVDTLELEGERRKHRDERQEVEVLFDRWIAARHRNQPAFEADRVGEDERPHREAHVADDVEDDEQAVVASYHRVPAGAMTVSWMTSRICCTCRWRANRSADLRMCSGSNDSRAARSSAAASASTSGSANSTPFSPSTTVSSAPPRPSATTGRPQA